MFGSPNIRKDATLMRCLYVDKSVRRQLVLPTDEAVKTAMNILIESVASQSRAKAPKYVERSTSNMPLDLPRSLSSQFRN